MSYLLNQALKAFDTKLGDIAKIAFHAETYMKSDIGLNLDTIFSVLRLFGLYLIVLKFLKKGFDTYILWNDGDADMDPFILATGFFKAIIVAVSFNTMYGFMIEIAMDLMTKVLNSINQVDLDTTTLRSIIGQAFQSGIIMIIVGIVYLILYVLLQLQFIKRGLEIFILKVGVPLACVGLMDSDGGVFKAYIKKFFQEIVTVLLQCFLLKVSMALMLNGHFMYAIAAISFSMKAPQFLQEFIMVASGGGQGIVAKSTQTIYTANMVRSFVK